MTKYAALFEDEDDIFGGTPKSKFWDIVNQASDDLVKDQFDMIFERFAVMEAMLRNHYSDEEIDRQVKSYPVTNMDEIENHKKSLYVEFTGDIVCRLDS
jgi:hypothetical protein